MSIPIPEEITRQSARRTAWLVFALLLTSYSFFWQARDWNTASRLMLTYALVDRGTIRLDGLNDQTRDIAFFEGHYYTDKLPGLSFLAIPAYAASKACFGYEVHALGMPGMTHLEGDYWATLGTSGLATATLGAWLVAYAFRLGCSPRRAGAIGLSYALTTPAYVYATLAYGHQVTALSLFAAFALLATPGVPATSRRALLAGMAVGLACVVELQVAPAAAVIGGLAIARSWRSGRADLAIWFGLGAVPPLIGLGAYNVLAFGSPLDMGYFHHATPQFARVHSKANPLGLTAPDWTKARELLVGGFRGITYYAPMVAFAPLGWWRLTRDRQWAIALVTCGVCLAVFLVNLSYPEWTGGWATGPRLLLPLLPFALVATACWLARAGRVGALIAGAAGLFGFGLMTLFVGVGGRVRQDMPSPLFDYVWPIWRHAMDLPPADGMTMTLLDLFPTLGARLPALDVRLPFLFLSLLQLVFSLAILGGAVRGTTAPESSGVQER